MTVASCLLTKAPIGSVKEDGSRAKRSGRHRCRANAKGHLDLAVKTYEQGKMSKHIGEMKVGDTLDHAGRSAKIAYKKNEFSEIGMVAGGTGITPMLQVVDEILDDPNDKTKVSLIFVQTDNDILLKAEIDARAAVLGGASRCTTWSTSRPASRCGRAASAPRPRPRSRRTTAGAGGVVDGLRLPVSADVQGGVRAEGLGHGPEDAGRARRAAQGDGAYTNVFKF